MQCVRCRRCNLTEARLDHATLTKTRWTLSTALRVSAPRAIFDGADLQQLDLSESDLTEASLQGVDLTKATLRGVILRSAQVCSSTLLGAVLQDLTAADSKWSSANMQEASLSRSKFERADFAGSCSAYTQQCRVLPYHWKAAVL